MSDKTTRARGTNVYSVNTPDGGAVLVEAATAAAAVKHVVGNFFKATRLNTQGLLEAVRTGATIERAGPVDDAQGSLDENAQG